MVFLFVQKIEAFTCYVDFLASLFVPFAGSILPGWRFLLLLCSLSFSFSPSHCSERRGGFFRENTARESVGLLSLPCLLQEEREAKEEAEDG